jgi:hypothetical protein
VKKLIILMLTIIILSCSKSTEPDTNTEWISISEFPNDIYIGNFNGYTEIDQHYNITNVDSTDWQIVEIDSNQVVNRWPDIENRFKIASANPSKTPIFNFNLAKECHVILIITTNKGELIKTLTDSPYFGTGLHCIVYNGENTDNNRIEPGLYRAHLSILDNTDTYFYSFGDFYLEPEFNWVQINQSAKQFADLHFSRETHSDINTEYVEAIHNYQYPDSIAPGFSLIFWEILPEEDNHRFYEDIALIDQNIFGWDDWIWMNNYEENIIWEFEIIDGFKVWKGNEVTNPESNDFGNILIPYSENRENYIQLINE